MTPIELNFHHKNFEVEKTFVKRLITWGDYKEIIIAQQDMTEMNNTAAIERISAYMVFFFDGQFSIATLEKRRLWRMLWPALAISWPCVMGSFQT